MKLSITKIIVFTALMAIFGATLYALEPHEKVTELNGMRTTITIKGDEQTAVMNGPIDLNHEGTILKADKGIINFHRDPDSNQIEMKSVVFEGSVKYSDRNGYSGNCGKAFYDFPGDEAKFSNGVKLSGNDMQLKGSNIEYGQAKQEFYAHKMVQYQGVTHHMPLLISGENDSDVQFSISTDDISIKKLEGKAQATGGVEFKTLDTTITCRDVDLLFADNEIVNIKASGGVKYKDPDMTAIADNAVYDKKSMTLTLSVDKGSKDVNVVFRGQEIKGREVIVNLADGREITLGGGRVNIVPRRIK